MEKRINYVLLFVSILLLSMAGVCLADTAAQLKQAKEFRENGYFQKAESIYYTVITENAGTDYALEAQKGLVFLYLMMQQKVGSKTEPETALKSLKADYSANAKLAGSLYDIAAEYERLRKYDQAKRLYQEIIKEHPDSTYADKAKLDIPKINILGLIQSRRDKAAQTAIDSFISQYSRNTNIAAALNDIAYQWRRFKNYPKAAALYQYVADTWPKDSDSMWAQMGVAKTSVEAGDFSDAVPAIEKLVKNYSEHPELATAIHYIARSYRKAGKYEEANNLYELISAKYPGGSYAGTAAVETAKMEILAAIKAGEYDKAQGAIASLISGYPGNLWAAEMLYQIPWEFERLGKYEEAAFVCQQIVDNYPDSFRAEKAWLDTEKYRMFQSIETGQDGNVPEDVNRLMVHFNDSSYTPDVVSAIASQYSGKAAQLEKGGLAGQSKANLEKAAAIYEMMVNKLPKSDKVAMACCLAADGYRKLGQYEKSNLYYQKVVDDYPQYEKAWHAQFMLGRNYEEMGKTGQVARTEANEKVSIAYQQLVNSYPGCKAAGVARRWLSSHP